MTFSGRAGNVDPVAAECSDRPFGAFGGTFDPCTGAIFLNGTFAGIEIDGTVSADGQSFSGTWRITPDGATGTIEGSRAGEPPDNEAPGDSDGPEDDADDEEPTAMPIVLPETGSGGASSGSLDFMLVAALAVALAAAGAAYAAGHRMRAGR